MVTEVVVIMVIGNYGNWSSGYYGKNLRELHLDQTLRPYNAK